MSSQQPATEALDVSIKHLREEDLREADRIFRLAFGTFMGIPDPAQFHAGADYIRTRWITDPGAAFAAKTQGRLVGTNLGTNWGSVGFFGPLTIHPDYWDRGIGKLLMEPIMALFSQWRTMHTGLFNVCAKPEARGSLSKVRVLATVSYCNNVEACKADRRIDRGIGSETVFVIVAGGTRSGFESLQ